MIIAIDTVLCLCCSVTLMHFSHQIQKNISVSSHIWTVCGFFYTCWLSVSDNFVLVSVFCQDQPQ